MLLFYRSGFAHTVELGDGTFCLILHHADGRVGLLVRYLGEEEFFSVHVRASLIGVIS